MRSLRLVSLLAIVLWALTAAACGGDDEGGGAAIEEEVRSERQPASPKKADTVDGSDGGEAVDARAVVDAFLIGVRDRSSRVVCGLVSERYAAELTGESELGAACVERLDRRGLLGLKRELRGIRVIGTAVADAGRSATVELSSGNPVKLKYQGGRFVIDGL